MGRQDNLCLRVSLGLAKGFCVLKVKPQVFSPQPISLVSIFITGETCAPSGHSHSLFNQTQWPLLRSGDLCGTFQADIHPVFSFGL